MISKTTFRYFVAVILFLSACKPDLSQPQATKGDADFSRFVAVGSDLTAGYTDGALTLEGQQYSFPAQLAGRFGLVGGGNFVQPLMNAGNGLALNGNGSLSGVLNLVKVSNCLGAGDLQAQPSTANLNDLQWLGDGTKFNNYGVPLAKSFNMYSQYFGKAFPAGNIYYHRFATDTGGTSGLSSTVLGDAFSVNPTFFSLWIGVNDVMNYAASGGIGSASGTNTYDITPRDTFNYALNFIVNSLTSNGANGVVLNIPDVTSFPYFTKIPWNGLVLTADQAVALNAVTPPGSGIVFVEGANAFVVNDPGTASIRQLKEGEKVLLKIPIDSIRCGGWGTPNKPISPQYILDSSQVSNVVSAIAFFNSRIATIASAKGLAFADMNALYSTFSKGTEFNGVTFSNEYLSGNAFSIDGLHMSPKGYALVTNQCIRAINLRYKSTLPEVDVNSVPAVRFP
jgi:lysophospholipase L1-like esterase